MPRPVKMSDILIPYVTAEEKQLMAIHGTRFAILGVHYTEEGRYGAKWECTIRYVASDGEVVEKILSLASNVLRDRWFEACDWQHVSDNNPIDPCILMRFKTSSGQTAWEIADPEEQIDPDKLLDK